MKMIKGAIFDMDGTLLDSMPIWEHASERYLKERNIKAQENLPEILFSMSMRQGAAYVKQNYNLTEDVDTIVAGVNAIVFDFYQKEAAPKAGTRQFLELLKAKGIRMAVATSTDRFMAEAALKRNGFMDYFEQIFTCTEVGAGKQKPDIYFCAQEVLGTEREATWVFEDALYAIDTAKKAGFPTVGIYDYASGKQQERIMQMADVYITDFTDTQDLRRLWE